MLDNRIDLKKVLAILSDEKAEIAWDACWDTLKSLDTTYRNEAGLLIDLLKGETTSFGRLYAMDALKKVGVPDQQITESFLPLLTVNDFEIQLEALKWIGSHEHDKPQTRAALRSFLTAKSTSLLLKLRAAIILL